MKFLKYIIICTFYVSFLGANEILLLHSYNKGLKWTDGISDGVEVVMKKYPNYEMTTEYMDSKKVESENYGEELLELYKKKFYGRQYKAIITADNYAYEFALKHHETLFGNAPIVFCGVENFIPEHIPSKSKSNVTGVVEYKDIHQNIELIYQLFPALEMVYIISDDAYSSLVIKEQIIEESNYFKDKFEVVFDNQIDFDKIDEKINNLPQNSAILFTSFYRDMYGNYVPYNKVNTFFKRSKFPVFALNQIHLGEGIIGGFMVNPYEQGFLAAEKVFRIISGREPQTIKVSIPENAYYFDNIVLEKFKLGLGDIPQISTVINEPLSFYDKHRQFVENVFMLMPILVILVTILVLNVLKRMALERELLRQNRLDNVLLNNIQSAIFWKTNEGIIIGCNDLLARLLNKEKAYILGRDIREVMPEVCSRIQDVPLDCITSEEVEIELYSGEKAIFAVRKTGYTDERNEDAGVVTILTDITEKKRIDTERKRHEQFVIQRSKQSEVGEMIASIAHQWKAPLVEISAIAQDLIYKRRKKVLDEKDTQRFVDDIMTQVQYMSNTIDDFRRFIKPSSMKITFDIKNAIQGLLSVVNHSVKYNYITLKIIELNRGPFLAYGYPNEFKQCVLNIINNAKDSILKKRETNTTKGMITIELSSDSNFVHILVSDDGCGIDHAQLESIFDPFMSTKLNGDGFGLYMARLIIEDKMGGKIAAHPKVEGACIAISIPITEQKEQDENFTT